MGKNERRHMETRGGNVAEESFIFFQNTQVSISSHADIWDIQILGYEENQQRQIRLFIHLDGSTMIAVPKSALNEKARAAITEALARFLGEYYRACDVQESETGGQDAEMSEM